MANLKLEKRLRISPRSWKSTARLGLYAAPSSLRPARQAAHRTEDAAIGFKLPGCLQIIGITSEVRNNILARADQVVAELCRNEHDAGRMEDYSRMCEFPFIELLHEFVS